MRIRERGLSTRKVGDEVVSLDLDSSRYLTISGSGVLLATFDVDKDTARLDVDAFIADLSDAGLLSR